MQKVLVASAFAVFGFAAVPANAMPVAQLHDAPSEVTPVAMGCGPGWTRGRYGHCHPMGGYGYGVAVPRVYGAYGGYGYHPYGYHAYGYHGYGYHPYGHRYGYHGYYRR